MMGMNKQLDSLQEQHFRQKEQHLYRGKKASEVYWTMCFQTTDIVGEWKRGGQTDDSGKVLRFYHQVCLEVTALFQQRGFFVFFFLEWERAWEPESALRGRGRQRVREEGERVFSTALDLRIMRSWPEPKFRAGHLIGWATRRPNFHIIF